ncbi:S-protein homolog 6 [Linum perenne]
MFFSSSNSPNKILTPPVTTFIAVIAILILALIPTSSAWWPWNPPTYRVHIFNDLKKHEDLLVHCDSSDHDRGVSYIKYRSDYWWAFKLHATRRSRWRCRLTPDIYRTKYFRAFDEDNTPDVHNNVYWNVREDGIYLLKDGQYEFTYHWENNTMHAITHS